MVPRFFYGTGGRKMCGGSGVRGEKWGVRGERCEMGIGKREVSSMDKGLTQVVMRLLRRASQ